MTPAKTKAPKAATNEAFKTNLPKTTGKFEMNPTSKDKPNATALPSFQQVVHLMIVKMENTLSRLIDIRCKDENWDEDDIDVDNASELALWKIQSMKTMHFDSVNAFHRSWFEVSAVMNLANKAFSRQDCYYARVLKGICDFFEQAAILAEFAQAQDKQRVAECAVARNDEALIAA